MKPLTLRFLVREWANFFFLINNLAFPIDSMHRQYNQEWLGIFGGLSNKEKEALQCYQKLWNSLGRRGGGGLIRFFEASFYQFCKLDPKEGRGLQKILEKGQLQELGGVFEVFQPRFRSMWGVYNPVLSRNVALLKSEFSSVQQDFNQAFFAVGKLYGVGGFSKRVEVYLMMRPYPGFVGGRMLSRSLSLKIMVEGGVFDPQSCEQKNHLWLLLLHELTHACFENEQVSEFLYSFLDKRPPLSHFLKKYPATKSEVLATRRAMHEMITNSIVLNSYVRERFDQSYTGGLKDGEAILKEVRNYLDKKSLESAKEKRSILLRMGRLCYQYIAWKLEKVVRPYLEEEQEIDRRFLDSVYKVLEEFPSNLLEDLKSAK